MSEDLINIVMNIHQFNQDLTSLNIKYSETIEEQQKEIERLNKELEELKHIMYIIRDDNGLNHLWCKDIILK